MTLHTLHITPQQAKYLAEALEEWLQTFSEVIEHLERAVKRLKEEGEGITLDLALTIPRMKRTKEECEDVLHQLTHISDP